MPATTPTTLRPPIVIHELIELLRASPVASDQTLIRRGLLPELPTLRERVYLTNVIDYALVPVSRENRVRREEFGIRGLIEVHMLGDDVSEQASTRAWELLSGLDDVLHQEEFSLEDGTGYSGALLVSGDEVLPASDGWIARLIFTVAMQSRR